MWPLDCRVCILCINHLLDDHLLLDGLLALYHRNEK